MALCNKLFLSSLAAGGSAATSSLSLEGTTVSLARKESSWEASPRLEEGCQFGSGLAIWSILFSPPMLSLCNVWSLVVSGREIAGPGGQTGSPSVFPLFYIKIWAPFCIMPSVSPRGLCALPQSSQSRQGQTREQSSSSVADMMISG